MPVAGITRFLLGVGSLGVLLGLAVQVDGRSLLPGLPGKGNMSSILERLAAFA